jgi:hypothetical protein
MTSAKAVPLEAVEDDNKPPARLSMLGQLSKRREEIKQGATTDLKVERWSDPEIWVRYKPVDHNIIRSGINRVEQAQPKDKARIEVDINSDVLIRGCVGVFARVNGKDYSLRPGDPHGEYTKFDGDLADNFELPEEARSARQVVKALYIFEGDIMAASAKIAEFSGYRDQVADEEVLGE